MILIGSTLFQSAFAMLIGFGVENPNRPEVGDETKKAYFEMRLGKSVPPSRRTDYVESCLDAFRNLGVGRAGVPIADADVPRYIAARALSAELGMSRKHLPQENAVFKRFPMSIRRKFTPFVQRLWLEAEYDQSTSDLSTVRTELGLLRRKGVDMDPLEAMTIGQGRNDPAHPFDLVEERLKYSETHPLDIVASYQAIFMFGFCSRADMLDRKPLRRDLVERILALEPKIRRNTDALLGGSRPPMLAAEIIRETFAQP